MVRFKVCSGHLLILCGFLVYFFMIFCLMSTVVTCVTEVYDTCIFSSLVRPFSCSRRKVYVILRISASFPSHSSIYFFPDLNEPFDDQ